MLQSELAFDIPAPAPAVPRRTPRERGAIAAEACVDKAERVRDFDSVGAATFIHGWVVRHGPTSGEDLVAAAKAHGFRGHDDRCFGAVFQSLVRTDRLRVVRSDLPRRRGHGTSGGKLYAAIR